MPQHLTAFERETVVLMSDGNDIATITTYQKRLVTKLERNPAATKLEDLTYGSTAGARFEMPASLVSFRSKRRVGPRGGNPEALAAARAARSVHS